MAVFDKTKFVSFTLPPCNLQPYNHNTFEPLNFYSSSYPFNTSESQNTHWPTTASIQSGYRAEGYKPASASDYIETANKFPSFEEHFQTAPPWDTSVKASKAEKNPQYLDRPACDAAISPVSLTKSELDERQVNNLDQPIILDNDEADEADIEDKNKDAFGNIGSCEQYSVPPVPTQAEPETLQPSKLLQDETDKQDMNDITQELSVGSVLHSPFKPSDNSNDGWTGDSMAELEEELGLALGEQHAETSLASISTSSSPRSVEAPQDDFRSQEHTGTTGTVLEELRDAARHGTPVPGFEEWDQLETEVVGETGGVAMQQQEELAAQMEQLGQPAVGDQQDLVEFGTDDPAQEEVLEGLQAAQPESPKIDEYHLRLRGVRSPAGYQKGTKYRVVWGEHANRSDFWVDEDDVRISMSQQSCERSPQDLDLPVERDVVRVRRMRCKMSSKGKKVFEYQVDKSRWINEEQLRISLSPILMAELIAPSPYQAQRDDILKHSPNNFEHRYALRASQSPSTSIGLALICELERGEKRRHQDATKETSSDNDCSHETRNEDVEDDEDPRPAKRRKLPTTSIDNTLTPPEKPTPVDDSCLHTPRTSRSPSITTESTPAVEDQEWSFQGCLKRTKIGDEMTYNLEFKLPSISEHFHVPINSAALDIKHDAAPHYKIHQAPLNPKKSKVPWTKEEDAKLLRMWNDNCSWKSIAGALPGRTEGTIRVRCSTKFRNRCRTRADRS